MNFIRQHAMGVFLSLALAFTICIVVFVAPHSSKDEGDNTTVSSSPQPLPTGDKKTPTDNPAPLVEADHTCKTVMGATAYQAFITRVLDYEQVQLSPDSPAKEAQLTQLATRKYLKDHPVVADPTSPTSGSDATISVNKTGGSQVSCIESTDGKTRYVSAQVEITTSAINVPFTLQPHGTMWVEEDGTWKVNQEQ